MPFDPVTGAYTAPDNSWNPAVAGTVIDPDDWNATQEDYVDAVNLLSGGSVVYAEAFGATGDGVTDDRAAIQAAIDSLPSSGPPTGGTVVLPKGLCLVSAPGLVISTPGTILQGQGANNNSGGTNIRGTSGPYPVIRVKARSTSLRDFIVTASNDRRAYGPVTSSTWVTSRDEQNYGIWIEAEDTGPLVEVTDCYICNVWVNGQPNSNWVAVGATYGSVFDKIGSVNSLAHGFIIDDGTYTDRSNLDIAGIIELRSFRSYLNAGNGLAVGNPTAAGATTLRVLVESYDGYSNATNAAVRFVSFNVFFVSDNSYISDSGIAGGAGIGGLYLAGRNVRAVNNRLLMTNSQPMYVDGLHGTGSRQTDGITIDGYTVTSDGTVFTDAVQLANSPTNVNVYQYTLDGTSNNAVSAGASKDERAGVRKWSGSLQLPNTGLRLLDTNASHYLTIAPGSDLAANRTLTLTTGDADRNLPVNATLIALANFNSDGVMVQTAASTFVARSIVGTANEVGVTNSNGVAGNPTIGLPSALTFTGKTITGGTFTGVEALNVLAPVQAQDGAIGLLVGADSNATTITNATTKAGRIATPHYTNSEEPVAIAFLNPQAASSPLGIGGGTSTMNAATQIDFYTGATTTSNTGTSHLRISSVGNVSVGNAAIATTATDGFLYIPTCAGTPTGTPTTITGRAPLVVNTTNNKLYFYSTGAWRDAGP